MSRRKDDLVPKMDVEELKTMAPKMFCLAKPLQLACLAAAALFLNACASSRGLDDTISDITTNASIKGVLFTDASHDYSDIDLTVFEGRLLLTGTMRTQEGRDRLIAGAGKVGGVKQIIDAIVVGERTTFGQGLDDTRIDQTLHARLIAHGDIRSGNYKIAVSNAAIHLIGSTRSQAELDKTLEIARSINGVKKILQYVTVRPLDNG